MSSPLEDLFFELQNDLDQIKRRFKSARVTLVVRNPPYDDADVVIGDDDLDEAIKSILKMKARKAFKEPAQ